MELWRVQCDLEWDLTVWCQGLADCGRPPCEEPLTLLSSLSIPSWQVGDRCAVQWSIVSNLVLTNSTNSWWNNYKLVIRHFETQIPEIYWNLEGFFGGTQWECIDMVRPWWEALLSDAGAAIQDIAHRCTSLHIFHVIPCYSPEVLTAELPCLQQFADLIANIGWLCLIFWWKAGHATAAMDAGLLSLLGIWMKCMLASTMVLLRRTDVVSPLYCSNR